MDKELKAKWVAALRSGAINQGRANLLDDEGKMCCLGVLGRILGISDHGLLENAGSLGSGGSATSQSLLPLDKCGLSLQDRQILASMNDGNAYTKTRKHSFAEIADYIEANL